MFVLIFVTKMAGMPFPFFSEDSETFLRGLGNRWWFARTMVPPFLFRAKYIVNMFPRRSSNHFCTKSSDILQHKVWMKPMYIFRPYGMGTSSSACDKTCANCWARRFNWNLKRCITREIIVFSDVTINIAPSIAERIRDSDSAPNYWAGNPRQGRRYPTFSSICSGGEPWMSR